MIKNINVEDFSCVCVPNNASTRIVFLIYPQIEPFTDDWLEEQARNNKYSLAVVYVPADKWNDCLTPWPEPGETRNAQPFAGEGQRFLKILQTQIVPQCKNALGLESVEEIDLVGVSLSGLFTFWQWILCDTFTSIACLSGSFWYLGFMDWFEKQAIPHKEGKAYFLLGTEEPKANIKAFRPVGVNTENIVAALKKAGIDTTFEWVTGNHFANPLQRAEKALGFLAQKD